MTWIKAQPIKQGALIKNWYNYTITGLTPSTTYRYRSFFIVDGVEYKGVNEYTATTAAINYQIPTVSTGNIVDNIAETSFDINNNEITSDGGASIIEYGILYTQLTAFNGSNTLVLSNYPTNVKKDSTTSSVSIPTTFSGETTGLLAGTNTYYRAFARNAVGVAYGQIYSQLTNEASTGYFTMDTSVFPGSTKLIATNYSSSKKYEIVIKYFLEADVANINGYSQNTAITEIIVYRDGVNYFSDSVQTETICEMGESDVVGKTGITTISDITNLNTTRITTSIDFENGPDGIVKGGRANIQLLEVYESIDNGVTYNQITIPANQHNLARYHEDQMGITTIGTV